ncbi:LysR family transcriptional regulator [Aestuariivirga sp.]|uniref:LysR family transcriptional regulator n=1 Tax=Aestuariivirga sp. TaxID=2650926 RepID=UPI003BAB46B0
MQRLESERMFVAVMETGSFAEAARRLGTSSGQASKLVSRLEADLGVRLLNRTTRALSPTEVGQAYYERIRLLIDELDSLGEAVKNRSGSVNGKLKLTAPLSFGTAQLAPALVALAQLYPELILDVSFSDRLVNLVDEGFDAAVRIGQQSDASLVIRKLCESRIVAVAAPAYLAKNGTPKRPEDLSTHHCIVDTNFKEREAWPFREKGRAMSVTVRSRLFLSNADACAAAAGAGLGITLVPSFVVGAAIKSGALVPLLLKFAPPPVPIQVAYPPGRHLALKVRALVDFLAERFRGEPEWDQGW